MQWIVFYSFKQVGSLPTMMTLWQSLRSRPVLVVQIAKAQGFTILMIQLHILS